MMKKFKTFISLGLLLFLLAATPFTSCRKSYLTEYIPFVEVKPNPSIGDSRAEITAFVVNETDQAIIHYGFEWTLTGSRRLLGQYRQTTDNFTKKRFSHLIDYALPNGDSIRIRAFVETQSQIIWSSPIDFKSKGSLPPEVDHYFPFSGTQSDTLYLEGRRFPALGNFTGFFIGDIVLTIGNTRAFVVESTHNRMKAIVPYISTHNESVFEIRLQIHDHDLIIIGDFEYIN